MYEELIAQHSSVFQQIANHFRCTDQDIAINKHFSEGKSGNLVLLICVRKAAASQDCGSYVLKIFSSENGPQEAARTHMANEHTGGSSILTPKLRLFSTSSPPFYLYDKVGDAFMQATSLAKMEPHAAARRLEDLSEKLLSEWNEHFQPQAMSLHGLIRSWLEERRLAPGSRLSQRIEAQITDELAPAFRFHEACYPNPLYFMVGDTAPLSQGRADLQCALFGQVHGDLNEHNVIVQQLPGRVGYQFSLIDFEQYRPQAPLLFDQAYLLLCLLLQDAACDTLIEWSEKVEAFFSGLEKLSGVKGRNAPPFSYMRAHINAMKWFINRQQEHNRSGAVWQLLAAHVAVGLNFINKRGSDDRQQKMALLYAATALRTLLLSLGVTVQEPADAPSLQASAGENSELWKQVDRFSADNRYIILSACGEEGAEEVMRRLSPIKWSLVVELNGLADHPVRDRVLPVYKRVQGYRLYSIPFEEHHEFEPAPAWLHLNISAGQKNQMLYYARHFQKELRQCLSAVLSLRENEPVVIIADFNADNLTVGQMLLQDILLYAGENTPVRIVSLNGVPLELDSEGLLQCTVSANTLEQLSQSVQLLFEVCSDPADVRVPCKDGMRTLPPEMVANLSNDMVLVHRNITYGGKDDSGDGFYRGNEATWRDIENRRDIPRWDYEKSLRDKITSGLEYVSTGSGAVFKVLHRPGGGGTTLAKRIAWDFCIKYPTVILHTLSDQTAERLKELYSKTIKPLLVIVEVSDGKISQERISMLRRELIPKSIRVLFLFISRTTRRGRSGTDNTFYLPNTDDLCMGTDESRTMYECFSQRLRALGQDGEYTQDILQRIDDLGLLTYGTENVELRQPFFYGLYTYGDGFHGITKYVERNSQGLSPDERMTVDILSMVTVFSQSVNLSFEETALFLYPGEQVTPEMSDRVKDWIYDHELVVRRGRGSRVCHPVIAEEFLRQSGLICPSKKENIRWDGTDGLLKLAIEFIDRMVDFYGADSRRLNDVFHDIFTHRTVIYEEEPQKFSVLLTWLYTRERCEVLLKHLAEAVPWNPHYKNHLARLYLYPVTSNQKQVYPEPETALRYADEAIRCAKELDNGGLSIHYHVQGKAYTKQCINKMSETLAKTGLLQKALSAAELSYRNACDAFNKCIAEDKSGYGLTGKLELYSNILQLIKSRCGNHASLSTILTWKKYSDPEIVQKIASYIAAGGDLIHTYISQFDTSSAAFRSACIRFYRVIGKPERLEMVFRANALTQEERCVCNRAIATVLMERNSREDKTFSYNEMSQRNLRRVHELMQENIAAVSDNVQDRIRWLETFRRLPEFDLREAYHFLMEWPDAEQNLFVCYYRYVVAFLMYATTGEVDYGEVKRHLNQTIDLSRNAYGENVTVSLNYYGRGETPVDLLLPRPASNVEDLKSARIEQHVNFRRDYCRIMRGQIETVDDGMLTIRFHIGHENDTFFAKSPNIYQISLADEGKTVQFVLGFSYSGMRSWDIQLASGT